MSDFSLTPFYDISYLSSSVETIKDSVEDSSSVTFHDLLDAYDAFADRLGSQDEFLVLQDRDARFPAFKCIILYKPAFLQALRRDIGLAHADPSIDVRAPPYEDFFPDAILADRRADPIQRARDSFLCHYALCALASIFKYPALLSFFTYAELAELFNDVLDISLARTLPVFNGPEIYTLSLSILRSQCLPLAVISPHRVDLVKVLENCLQAPERPVAMIVDGLEAVIHLLDHYTKDLFGTVAELLPSVLNHLLLESTNIRLLASVVLIKLAALLIKEPEGISKEDRGTASTHIFDFLHGQAILSKKQVDGKTFIQAVQVALEIDVQASSGNNPIWMVSVLASLVVLCGPSIFSERYTLEYVLDALENLLVHRDAVVRALHTCVWRCLVWVYAQMLAKPDDLNSSVVDLALCAVKQELGRGMGIVVTSVLLCGRDPNISTTHLREDIRLKHVLSIIQCMVQSECAQMKKDGVALLRAITATKSSVGDRGLPKGLDDILPVILFDSTATSAQWGELPTIIRGIPRFTVDDIFPFTETQVSVYFEALFDGWCQCMPRSPSEHLGTDLVDIWRSLLYALAQNHPNVREAFNHAAISLTGCLLSPSHDPDEESNQESRRVIDQYQLIAVERLWSAMKDVVATSRFPEAAHLILSAVLKHGFKFLDPEVRCTWNTLCVDLVTFASASVQCGMPTPPESLIMVTKHRELWASVAESLSRGTCNLPWKVVVDFLCIPVRTWVLSESELGIWGSLLQCAKASSKDWNSVVEGIADRLVEQDTGGWESVIQLFTVILSTFKETRKLPPNAVLRVIDKVLTCAYGQDSTMTGTLNHVLCFFVALRDHIIVSAPEDVMKILVALRTSLNLWIGDEMEVMTVDAFNSVVIILYSDTLKVLEKLPLSQGTLDNIESFIASGFSRIPVPAIAPFAFERFWRATYYGQTQFYDSLPQRIKVCLSCFVDAFGGDLAHGLAISADSQSQSQVLLGPVTMIDKGVHDPLCGPSLVNQSSFSYHAGELHDARFVVDTAVEEEVVPLVVDTTFILPSSDASQDEPLDDEIDDYHQLLSASILHYVPAALPSSRLDCKRSRTPEDNSPRKRGRISPKIPMNLRKTVSEPVSRRNTPLTTVRLYSVPVPKKRIIFDCVEVPTLRSILEREKTLQSQNAPRSVVRLSPFYQAPPVVRTGSTARVPSSPLPPSVSSEVEDDEDDCHDPRGLEITSSEIVVDESLAQAYPSSPLRDQGPTVQDSDVHDRTTLQIRAQTEVPLPGPSRVPLRRSKTASARLDALQDAYTAVTDGACQISVTDLVKATTLVHQIGAALDEQISKRFGKPT